MDKHFNIVKTFALKASLIVGIIATFTFVAYAAKGDAKSIDFNNRFMIGIFSVRPISDMPNLKKIGFNCVQAYENKIPYLQDFISECWRNSLFVLVYPGPDFEQYGPTFESTVKDLVSKNNLPKVIWYIGDEPDLKKDPAARKKISVLNLIVKSTDPDATTALTAGWWTDYADWADITDIFMIDIYPIGKKKYNFNDDVGKVSEYTRKAVRASKGKPVWVILQAFGYQDEQDSGFGWTREPTYDEMRAMTYLAIINGAKGVFYYTYECHGYKIKKSKQHWNDLQSIIAELNNYLPVLTAEASDKIIVDDLNGKNAIEYSVKKYQDKYYLFAVNETREGVKARIRKRAGVFTEKFKPLETKIYVFD